MVARMEKQCSFGHTRDANGRVVVVEGLYPVTGYVEISGPDAALCPCQFAASQGRVELCFQCTGPQLIVTSYSDEGEAICSLMGERVLEAEDLKAYAKNVQDFLGAARERFGMADSREDDSDGTDR